jgi:GNAT superfamily N-acetyltransferase
MARLVGIWVRATDAGGALGFLAPAQPAEVARAAAPLFSRVREGRDDLLLVVDEEQPVGWCLLEADARSYASHWRTLRRLQVDPAHQRRGHGSAMLKEVARHARDDLGLELLLLHLRSGTGLEDLYGRHGWTQVARIPGLLRIAPGDDRDEIVMRLELAGHLVPPSR